MTWIILALVSAITGALVAIFGKVGLNNFDVILGVTVRAIIMAIFLIVVLLLSGKFQLLNTIDNKSLGYIFLASISGVLSWLAYFLALKFGPASGVAALDKLSVVFVLIFSVVFLAEKLTLYKLLGVILMIIGAILIVL